jgi:threonine/homoserine/homoserine lactone efflux protein
MALDSLRVKPVAPSEGDAAPHSIAKGFMANLFNPHPYLFWFTIGGTRLVTGWETGVIPVVGFLCGLYGCLIGAKMLVAVLVGRSRSFLQSRAYLYVNRLLGLVLFGYAVVFTRDGLRYLGWIS